MECPARASIYLRPLVAPLPSAGSPFRLHTFSQHKAPT